MLKNVNIGFIKSSIKNRDLMNFICVSYMVKDRYVSSTINNYTKTRLAKILGMGVSTLQKAIQEGKKSNLCELKDGNLVFYKFPKSTRGFKIKKLEGNFKQIRKYLKSLIICDKLRTMTFCSHSTSRMINKKTFGLNARTIIKGSISYRKISQLLHCSIPTAINQIKFAVENNILKKKTFKCVRLTPSDRNGKIHANTFETFQLGWILLYQQCNEYRELRVESRNA